MRKLIVLPDGLHESIKRIADSKNLSINALIRMILTEYVNVLEEPHKPPALRNKRVE